MTYMVRDHIEEVYMYSDNIFVEVDFLWNRTVDSLKTSFHLLL